MSNNRLRKAKLSESKKEVDAVKNQINESYQSGVVEDKLEKNRGIYTFNNQSK